MRRRGRPTRPNGRDVGATLVMILVLIAVAGMLLVPTMGYAVTVMRSNDVLSDRTASAEAAKAGLRTALADPRWLYERCSSTTPTPLSLAQLEVATTTTCELVQEVTRYQLDELPWAVTTTWFGATPPADGLIEGTNRPGDHATAPIGDASTWISLTTPTRIGPPTTPGLEAERGIWLPRLPTPATTSRAAIGYAMPSGQVNPGFADCTVYFPGTYVDPVVVDGPTYFTSGVYYFEAPLTVVDGAAVVFGSGQQLGCTDDQRAAFSAIGVPATHNITGVGATIVFGEAGRLTVGSADSTSPSPISFKMNTRYVSPESPGLLPSVEVSIQTVNGVVDEVGNPADLNIAGGLHVPVGTVGGDSPITLTDAGYQPSTVIASPTGPTAVGSVTVDAYDSAIAAAWQPPVMAYGVEGYVATATPSDGTTAVACTAPRFRRSCVIAGLTNDVTHTVTVVAVTANGGSAPASGGDATPGASLGTATPDAVAIDTSVRLYDDFIVIAWQPLADGSIPADTTTATVAPVVADDGAGGTTTIFDGGTCTSDGEFPQCAVAVPSGVADQIATQQVDVTAIASNSVGDSPVAATSVVPTRISGDYQVPTSPPQDPPPADSVPVIDISTASTAKIDVDIPGYVAVPQGGIILDHPSGSPGSLRLDGGLVAATIAVAPTCGSVRCTVGQTNEPIQRIVRLVTTTTEGVHTRSDAVAQINSNGAWVVNSWEIDSY